MEEEEEEEKEEKEDEGEEDEEEASFSLQLLPLAVLVGWSEPWWGDLCERVLFLPISIAAVSSSSSSSSWKMRPAALRRLPPLIATLIGCREGRLFFFLLFLGGNLRIIAERV